jgi:hypothetical protein
MINKINGYIGLCQKAGYIVAGSDNLKDYEKKLYLVVIDKNYSDNILKIANQVKDKYKIDCIILNDSLDSMIGINNCKIIGIRNLGLSKAIIEKCADDYKKIDEVI